MKKSKKTKLTGKSLVIVESPAKVKTLSKILGPDYTITASYGHVRDLPKGSFGLDLEKDFAPTYKTMPGRAKNIVKELKSLVKKVSKVILATDPDREGEAIAWHIVETLKLPEDKIERVTFNEITPPAVLEAVKNPRRISVDLVNAQQARRFLDRIVGYKLSPLLWKKIARGLSAGRVQSVAVKLLVDREKEISLFKPQEYWKISADFKDAANAESTPFNAALYSLNDMRIGNPADNGTTAIIPSETEANKLARIIESEGFVISKIAERENYQHPAPPFITSTLQQQSANQLGFSTKKTMMIAQQLYEGVEIAGEPTALITYMRTDSVRVSDLAVSACRNFIAEKYGNDFVSNTIRLYKTRKTAQAAHEAIRPTYIEKTPAEIKDWLTPEQYKIYDIIWRRFVGTQMASGKWKAKTITIESNIKTPLNMELGKVSGESTILLEKHDINKFTFTVSERQLLFKGFLVLYSPEETILTPLKENENVAPIKVSFSQHFTQPPPRFNEASLVKTLEKYGIGRPSTYSPIISTIQDRGYALKNNRQLVPTELGTLVTEKLIPYFTDILNINFTSQMEERLDKIEEGEKDWVLELKRFYEVFNVDLERATNEMETEKGKEASSGEKCAKLKADGTVCGKPMVERWGRYGKFVACSGYPECKNIVSTKPPLIAQVTNEVCEKCGKSMVIKRNRRGQLFLACPGYPDCKNAKPYKKPKEADETPAGEETKLSAEENTEENQE
jgi:DNA topoisomerase-1